MDTEYSALPNGGFLERALASQCDKLRHAFTFFKQPEAGGSVLNVGIFSTPPLQRRDQGGARIDSGDRSNVTSCLISPLAGKSHSHADAPKHQPVDGRHLPFSDGEFDWVFCNQVIEHVGSFERQYELLKEFSRVSRKGIFVTTPNRWHPIEFNTGLWCLHWLPTAWWRRILKWAGKGAWASESVLNLLDADTLRKLGSLLPGKPKSDIGHLRILGMKAHFFLQIRKNTVAEKNR
jgi:hypothetical protein